MVKKSAYSQLEQAYKRISLELDQLRQENLQHPLLESFGKDLWPAQASFVSEMYITEALSGCKVGLWWWDPEQDKIIPSDSYFLMLGFKPGEILAKRGNWLTDVHSDDDKMLGRRIKAFMTSGSNKFEIEFRVINHEKEIL